MSKEKISMIDISNKKNTIRIATARGKIHLKKETIKQITEHTIKKGDPLVVGKIAAMQAIKRTPELIPMCHQIPITDIDFKHEIKEEEITVEVTVKTVAQTGVEMEAVIGVNIFLSTIWDMVKYLEKDQDGQYPVTTISEIKVTKKEKIKLE
ncbi:MAG: cyclic pyranopterin monophosphate synthase MoaC [Candidatus Heimdallarchaeaceae archaeon]